MTTVMTWDGRDFDFMPRAKAEELERKGKLQIATGLQSQQLKTLDELKKTRQLEARRKRQGYVTKKRIPRKKKAE